MADQKKDQQMDEILDALLSNYSAVQPRPGLETRILANIRDVENSAKSSQSWGFKWIWGLAAACTVIIALAVLIGLNRKIATPTITSVAPPALVQTTQQRHLQTKMTVASAVNHSPKKHAQPTIQSASLPINQRPDVFPTPEPLSEEEKLLVRYVTRTPREELMAQSRPFEPFRLEPEGNKAGTNEQKPKESTETR